MLWDIIQHFQITGEVDARRLEAKALAHQNASIKIRVAALETELQQTRDQLKALTLLLEKRFGEDLNGDGKVET